MEFYIRATVRTLLTVHCFCLQSWWVMLDNLVSANTNSQAFSWLSGALAWGPGLQCVGTGERDLITFLQYWGIYWELKHNMSSCGLCLGCHRNRFLLAPLTLSKALWENGCNYRLPTWFMCSCPSQINLPIYKSLFVSNISLLRNFLESSPTTKSFARTKIHYIVLLEMSNLKNSFQKTNQSTNGIDGLIALQPLLLNVLITYVVILIVQSMPENSEKYPKVWCRDAKYDQFIW